MKIDDFYLRTVCGDIALQAPEMNKRTGVEVRALPGVTFQTDLEQEGFPLLSLRKIPMSFVPEQMWMLSGTNTTEWLSRHTKIWDSFTEFDGTITSAYGHRWRHWFRPRVYNAAQISRGDGAVDQINIVLAKLKVDPSSRHAVVMMWDPGTDLIVKQKNVPCPVMFTLNVIHGRLNLHLIIRSNDMVLGFPTDVAGFALLQHILAQKLGVSPGVYTHSISNAHVYENQMYAIEEMRLRRPDRGNVQFTLPADAYKRACDLDDSLVQEIKDGFTNYLPLAAITGIPIAL
jgi:thymidylate synthase